MVYCRDNYALTLRKHYFSKATMGLSKFVNIWREGLRGSVVNFLFYKQTYAYSHIVTLMKDFQKMMPNK